MNWITFRVDIFAILSFFLLPAIGEECYTFGGRRWMTESRFRMSLVRWLSAMATPLALDVVFAVSFVLLLAFCTAR